MIIARKTAVVTGSASGLGLAAIRALLSRGARIVALDLTEAMPQDLRDNPDIFYRRTDVTDEDAIVSALAAAREKFGSIDICVNSAGIFHSHPVVGDDGVYPLAAFRRVVDINLNGTFAVLTRAAEHMAQNAGDAEDGERGVIINVASIRAFDGGAGGAAYAASKGAVVALTLSLARDLAPHRIRANSVAPGIMNTELFHNLAPEAIASHIEKVVYPKRLGDPTEFASLVCHLIENRYMNGETIRIDGAMRV